MKAKKTKVYMCKHFEYDYDDFDKYFMCNIHTCCRCAKRVKYIKQFCPDFEPSEIADCEKEDMEINNETQ